MTEAGAVNPADGARWPGVPAPDPTARAETVVEPSRPPYAGAPPARPYRPAPTPQERTADSRGPAGGWTSGPRQGLDAGLYSRGPRRARLVLKHIDPWTVMKFALLFSLGMLVVFVIAVMLLYVVLDGMGVFSSINTTVGDLTSSGDGSGGVTIFSGGRVFGGAIVIGLVNVVLITALMTLGAFLYNLCADLVGGVEVTMTER